MKIPTPIWGKKGYSGLDDWAGGLARDSRDRQLRRLLTVGLTEVFGQRQGRELLAGITRRIEAINIPFANKVPEVNSKPENTWVVYPGTFGGFTGLATVIPALAKLGVTQVHVLPLYETGGDDGFSVINYEFDQPLKIAEQWGGEAKLTELVGIAQKQGIKLMFDAVLNHIDIQSPLLANGGLEDLTLCFKAGETPFKFIRVEDDPGGGRYAVYKYQGKEVRRMIIFPEQARVGKDEPQLVRVDGRDVWHTFYPFQLDLDLNKPAAFTLAVNTLIQISQWLNGEGTIRLDAIPFVGKKINAQVFEYMDSDRGYQLISLLRLVVALAAPRIKLLAEAARPLKELTGYPDRVGGAYDFYSLPLFLSALLTENAADFVSGINVMIKELGLSCLKKLAFILQTHDDYPITGSGLVDVAEIWRMLKEKGAHAFGGGNGGVPRAAVIRLSEICGGNEAKLLAALALASIMPHGQLLWLYGTEVGVKSSRENLELDRQLAKQQGRQVEKRALIRQPLNIDVYLKMLRSDLSQKLARLLQQRLALMPGTIDDYRLTAVNGGAVVTVAMSGRTKDQRKQLRGIFNLSSQTQSINGQELAGYGFNISS